MPSTNRLIHETSPYLLQHARNPVDWYPWGPEAIEKARRENKPIFLSVGYSTCYWCHVMERQSFENEQVAKEMNERFINIKVDREERPDVDQLYMTVVQVMTRQGGWPMSVFMTPALEPFYAGTYFPPQDGYGRPGFPRLLALLEEAYRQRPGDVKQTTDQLRGILRQLAEPRRPSRRVTIDAAAIEEIIDRSVSDFDPVHGGFGGAPKFPRQTLLQLLLVHNSLRPNEARMQMLTRTLDALANGGIRDHLGGGFHRYSTDAEWLVPHFEIMLYDNAMLGWVYVEAFGQTGEGRYAKAARGIFDFVLREMTSPDGAFYTAFDAEVDSMEGANYLWTKEEIEEVLAGMDTSLFLGVYGVDRGPNFADPHHGNGMPDRNILYLPKSLEQIAAEMKISMDELDSRLAPMRKALYTARMKRKQPLLDTKVLTSWNALMIRAMAHGGRVLNEPRYTEAAEKSATFLLERHRDSTGQLYRTSRAASEPKFAAFLDDYAFLDDALLELGWKKKAAEIADVMAKEFAGTRGGFYFSSASATDLIVRQMIGTDSPLPSGNGVAAKVLLALGRIDHARQALAAFAQAIEDHGEGMSALVEAAARYVETRGTLVVEAEEATGVERPNSPQDLAARVVSIQGRWKDARELHLELTIEDGFHIQSHDAGAGLIATTLTAPVGAVVQYPPGVEREFGFSQKPVRVYDGSVTIAVRFATPPSGPVKLGLRYQACDESACLPKVTKMIEISL